MLETDKELPAGKLREKMATHGKNVYLRLYETIRALETDSRKLSASLSSAESEIRNLVSTREGLFKKLAVEYLPEMDSDSIGATIQEVQYDIHRIYEEKEHHRQELETEAAALVSRKKTLENDYEKLTEELNKLAEKRLELEEKVAGKLEKNPDFIKQCEQSSTFGEKVKQYQVRAEEMALESEEKLPEFKEDKLFSYLLECNYGTARYKGRGLRKRMDSWVARQVKFSDQYKNFQFLQTTPEIMALEVEKIQDELDGIMTEVSKIEKVYQDKYGLTDVIEKGLKVGQKREELMAALEELEESYAKIVGAREELENDRGHYHKKALKKIGNFLESQPVRSLRNQAAKQPGKTDDLLVDQIDKVEKAIDKARETASLVETERSLSENKLESLGRICAKYRRKDFDSARSFFSDKFSIADYLKAFMGGSMTEASFWSALVHNQNFSRPARGYSPIFDQMGPTSQDMAGVFGRALGEMILSGQMGRRRRSWNPGFPGIPRKGGGRSSRRSMPRIPRSLGGGGKR